MTRTTPLPTCGRWGNVSVPSSPTFHYRRDILSMAVFCVNYVCRLASAILAGSGRRGSRSTTMMPVSRVGGAYAVQSGVENALPRRDTDAAAAGRTAGTAARTVSPSRNCRRTAADAAPETAPERSSRHRPPAAADTPRAWSPACPNAPPARTASTPSAAATAAPSCDRDPTRQRPLRSRHLSSPDDESPPTVLVRPSRPPRASDAQGRSWSLSSTSASPVSYRGEDCSVTTDGDYWVTGDTRFSIDNQPLLPRAARRYSLSATGGAIPVALVATWRQVEAVEPSTPE